MATKHTDTCLQNAADDEPIFVLRAQDRLASDVVDYWADLAEEHGTPDNKVTEARQLARLMRVWQTQHSTKIPD